MNLIMFTSVLLLTIDTLPAKYVTPERMPLTTKHMQSATVYTHAYSSSSWTLPAMYSIMLGEDAATHGAIDMKHAAGMNWPTMMAWTPFIKKPMLAEVFKKAGYCTGAFVNQPILTSKKFQSGFDVFEFYDSAKASGKKFEKISSVINACEFDSRLLDQAIKWSHKACDKLFIWVHMLCPHSPYKAQGDTRKDKFIAELGITDKIIDRALRDIKSKIKIVTADHGEEFKEHGHMGHGNSFYEETVRVPLFIVYDKPTPAILPAPVPTRDIYRSLHKWIATGGKFPSDAKLLMLPGGKPINMAGVGATISRRALLVNGTKIILDAKGNVEVFDLAADPGEKENLFQMWTSVSPKKTEKFKEGVMEAMRGLGYLR